RPKLAKVWERLAAAYQTDDLVVGLPREEADAIAALLAEQHMHLQVDYAALEEDTEAWVWVRVAPDVASWQPPLGRCRNPDGTDDSIPLGYRFAAAFAAFAGSRGVLVFANCD